MGLSRLSLRQFLSQVNEPSVDLLPLVHTTQGFHFAEILQQRRLLASDCDVFVGEKLCYLFLGRPAYRVLPQADPEYWELPIAFVTKFSDGLPIKRVFPFDSGAFQRGILPKSITGFDIESYNIADDPTLVRRLVATFFGDNSRYLKGMPKTREAVHSRHDLGASKMEIDALAKLYNLPRTSGRDDRASTMEIQLSDDRSLTGGELLGIVLPREYGRDPDIRAALAALTARVEYYDIWPIDTQSYHSEVRRLVAKIVDDANE